MSGARTRATRRTRKAALLCACAGLLAVVMSGCDVFMTTPTAVQNGIIGSVHVSFQVCASQTAGSPPPGSCPRDGNSGDDATTDTAQVFIGFRVPAGTAAPASFSSSATGPSDTGPQLTFMPSSSYTGELERLTPAPAGEEWLGYVSQALSYNKSSGEQNFTASADLGLPPGPGGAAYTGPFTYRVVVGGRAFTAASPDLREPIDCGASAYSGNDVYDGSAGYGVICIDDPSQATATTDATLPTRDAAVVAGAPVKASQGSKAKLPFTFSYAGAAPGASFTLSASSSLHGASPSPSTRSINPTGTSSTPLQVSLHVPKHAAAGTYLVTLTATLSDGESRSATIKLVVEQACRVPRLLGKDLGAVRKALKKAHCSLGHVSGKSSGKVVSQHPKPGKTRGAGSKVRVKLG